MWPEANDFIRGEPLPAPEHWSRPGLIMFFNLECPGCVSRGIPFLKKLLRRYGERLTFGVIHTAYGHKRYPRDEVAPTLERFVTGFARLGVPVALDLDGHVAEHWQVEGTPHWLVFESGGRVLRSIYGSQDNARTRLEYLLAELNQPES